MIAVIREIICLTNKINIKLDEIEKVMLFLCQNVLFPSYGIRLLFSKIFANFPVYSIASKI